MNARFLTAMTLILCSCMHQPSLHAELLIMKQIEDGFTPLDETDKQHWETIEKILLDYEWPMSAAHAFDTADEKQRLFAESSDLFAPEKPNAEEIFIESKIKEKTGNESYRVIFIPTTLYELFVIYKSLSAGNASLIKACNALSKITELNFTFTLNETISTDEPKTDMFANIKSKYRDVNNVFYGGPNGAFYSINQALVKELLEIEPALKKADSSQDLSAQLKNISETLLSAILDRLKSVQKNSFKPSAAELPGVLKRIFDNKVPVAEKRETILCKNIIDLEYEARSRNNALLLRGSTVFEFKTIQDADSTKKLIGTTLKKNQEEDYYTETFYQSYSISFGNSLFAGLFHDLGACAFNYLTTPRATGYALLIKKNAYIKNQNDNLFLISALSPLAGIFVSGEWFHSRTKAAKPTAKTIHISGLAEQPPTSDPYSIITFIRDPFEHAALFSKFIVDHGRILTFEDMSTMPEQERKAIKTILSSQDEAAGYYKGIKRIKEWGKQAFSPEKKQARHNKYSTQSENR